MSTIPDIGQLMALAAKATPGPWMTDPVNRHLICVDDGVAYRYILSVDPGAFSETDRTDEADEADAAFVAAANPKAVTAMVNEILYLRASVRELLTVCEDWQVGESARMRAKALLDAARKAEGAQHG